MLHKTLMVLVLVLAMGAITPRARAQVYVQSPNYTTYYRANPGYVAHSAVVYPSANYYSAPTTSYYYPTTTSHYYPTTRSHYPTTSYYYPTTSYYAAPAVAPASYYHPVPACYTPVYIWR